MPAIGNLTEINLSVIGPEICLVFFALVIMTIDMFSDKNPPMLSLIHI